MAIKATGRATFTAVEDYDVVFVLNGIRCDVLNFDSVRTAESAVLEADFFNGGTSCVVDKAILGCYDGEGSLLGSPIEVHDASSAVADGGSLYLSKDCKTITCDIYAGGKKLCGKSLPVIRNGSSVGVKAVSYKVINNVASNASLNWDSVTSQTAYPTQKPDKGKYCYVMTIVLYTDGTTTNTVSTSYTPNDGASGTSVKVASTKVEYAGGDSGTSAPTSGWQGTVPQLAQGKYLWTRTTVTYSDGKSTTSYSVGRIGMDGSKGGTTHILYASSASPKSAADVRTTIDASHQYYGTYQDTNVDDDVNKYTSVKSWVLIKGDDGKSPQPNLCRYNCLIIVTVKSLSYDLPSNTYTIVNNTPNSRWGSQVYLSPILIPYGQRYTASADVYSPVAATIIIDFNNGPVSGSAWGGNGNDNDDGGGRSANRIEIPANTWTTISWSAINSNTANTNKVGIDIFDSIGSSAPADTVWKLRNLKVEFGDTATPWVPNKEDINGTQYRTVEKYAYGTSNTAAPTSGWSDSISGGTAGQYLWNQETTQHKAATDTAWVQDSVTTHCIGYIAKNGENGANFTGVLEYYKATNDGTNAPAVDSSWQATPTAAGWSADKPYLWNYEIITRDKGGNITTKAHLDSVWGKDGEGQPATVYTIEAVGNSNNSGTLKNASTIAVTLTGNLKLYKTVGSEKTEDSKPPQCWRLTVGGTNVDGTRVFINSASNNIVSYSYNNSYSKDTVPGSATISVYKDSSMGELLASLVVPISLNPGAIVDVNRKLGTIENTTMSMQNDMNGMHGTIETIRQGQGQISLKVQDLARKGGNILPGGNVNGLFNKKYSVFVSDYFTVEKGKTYTVTANVYKDTSGSHIIDIIASRSDWSHQYHGQTSETDPSNKYCYSFTAVATEQLRVGFYERTSSGDDPGSYEGVHLNWVRVDEGDWTGDARLSEWGPSDRETDAVNLLPDPSFSQGIGFTDGMGERKSYADNMGDTVSWMSRDASADGDGCHAVLFNRSSSSQTSSGIRYLIPFRGAGTYYLSYVYTDLSQTDSSYPGMTDILAVECHPCDADGNRITGGFGVYRKNTSSKDSGIIRCGQPYTFGVTATNGSGTRKDVVYLEVRVYLSQRGAVRVSRICLSKSGHYIYWNANAVSKDRKSDAALLATGIDIESKTVKMTGQQFVWQNNAGVKVAYMDDNGNATFSGVINATGGNFTGTVTGATIVGSTLQSSDGTNTTTIKGGNITTNSISATGGSIGAWTIKDGGLSAAYGSDAKISLYSSSSFFELDSNMNSGGGYLLRMRNDNGGVIDLQCYADNKTALSILSNGANTVAISALGNSNILSRIGEGTVINRLAYACARVSDTNVYFDQIFVTRETGNYKIPGNMIVTTNQTTDQTIWLPKRPVLGVSLLVIQGTNRQVNFNGNRHSFQQGSDVNSSANSNRNGQWNLFIFDGQYWQCIYITGHLLW